MYNLKNMLVIYLVSYIKRLHQEITNLKDFRVYSYCLLSSNREKTNINMITLQKLRNFPTIKAEMMDKCWRRCPHISEEDYSLFKDVNSRTIFM